MAPITSPSEPLDALSLVAGKVYSRGVYHSALQMLVLPQLTSSFAILVTTSPSFPGEPSVTFNLDSHYLFIFSNLPRYPISAP